MIKYGDIVGTHGADVVSVNSETGEVTLWDSKWRSRPTSIKDSPTFAPGSPARSYAVNEAIQLIIDSGTLSPETKEKAIDNLLNGIVQTRTAGSGTAKNSRTGH